MLIAIKTLRLQLIDRALITSLDQQQQRSYTRLGSVLLTLLTLTLPDPRLKVKSDHSAQSKSKKDYRQLVGTLFRK